LGSHIYLGFLHFYSKNRVLLRETARKREIYQKQMFPNGGYVLKTGFRKPHVSDFFLKMARKTKIIHTFVSSLIKVCKDGISEDWQRA
jgi:hypothetical protein